MYPQNTIDIILLTCNRKNITKQTINDLYERVKFPEKIRLIVVDDESVDGTIEMLREMKAKKIVDVLIESKEHKNICMGYNEGFKHVKSNYFITAQDDITLPDLKPDVIQQLIDLMEKYPENGTIGLRIQRIPNLNWEEGNEDLLPARKAASAYFRIQRKSDMLKLGENPFGNREWDDIAIVGQIRGKLGKECSWTKKLWADHSRGYCLDRGYLVKPRKWGRGIHSRTQQAHIEKPYPIIDPKTNIPLEIINADKIVEKELNPDQIFFGFKMRTRKDYHDERILNDEMSPKRDVYRLPSNPKLVIDVGAHIGGTALICAKRGATVLAFEPELSNFNILQYNVRRNKLQDKIHCYNLGVGAAGRDELYVYDKNSGATSAGKAHSIKHFAKKQIVVVKSLQDIFDEMNIEYCDLLKMDCEGCEEDIIMGIDNNLVKKIGQISVEFHNGRERLHFVEILSKWYDGEMITKFEWVFRRKVIK